MKTIQAKNYIQPMQWPTSTEIIDTLKAGEDVLIKAPKPELKIIDLSMMFGSGVDMEVCKDDINWKVTQLQNINTHPDNLQYQTHLGNWYPKCRIRQDKWMSWQGGKYPIPSGLKIEILFRDNERALGISTNLDKSHDAWVHDNLPSDIIAFKVIGVAEGWEYEWEGNE